MCYGAVACISNPYLSPVLFIERSAKLLYSWNKSGEANKAVQTYSSLSKELQADIKQGMRDRSKEAKTWLKSRFDNGEVLMRTLDPDFSFK